MKTPPAAFSFSRESSTLSADLPMAQPPPPWPPSCGTQGPDRRMLVAGVTRVSRSGYTTTDAALRSAYNLKRAHQLVKQRLDVIPLHRTRFNLPYMPSL